MNQYDKSIIAAMFLLLGSVLWLQHRANNAMHDELLTNINAVMQHHVELQRAMLTREHAEEAQ